MICFEQRQDYFNFLNSVNGTSFSPSDGGRRVIANLAGQHISAVVMFSGFTPRACELSIATDQHKAWATRGFLQMVFAYPFLQLGVARCYAVISEKNLASLEMCRRLGFVQEGVIREGFADGINGILVGMLRKECKWI